MELETRSVSKEWRKVKFRAAEDSGINSSDDLMNDLSTEGA
jgi:hypothetical protein